MQKENQHYNIQPADRLASVSEYYFSRKLKEVAKMNAEGKDVISLGIGSPDMPPSEETINVLCENARKADAHGYQPTVGIPELRKAMADWYKRWYNVDLDPATEIQPLIGSKEGILHVTLALVNPGDQVLVPNPGYPTYTSLNKILGSEIVNYNLREDNHWQPDFDELEKMDLSRVKIMWTNYPNMPTGANATMELYEKLVDFARRHNIVIVNDNPYSFILNHKPISILNVPGAKECCIEFNSMSKSHNMPGWRVGMLATNATFVQWILKIKSNIDSGTFRPMQLAAAQAYRNSAEWHEEANINVYSRRRKLAEEIMTTLGCTFDSDQVGMFLWGKIPESYTDVEDLTEKVLHEARVFITPGFIFGSNGKRYIRISLCAKEEKLAALKEDLEAFHCEFDVWFSEQSLHDADKIHQVVDELQEKGYVYEKDGAKWFKSTAFGDDKDRVVIRDNGVSTYFAADIAYHQNKFQRGFDRVINLWGADHHGYIPRVKAAMEALGYDPSRLEVLILQMVALYRNGELVKMSKRTGKSVTLNELIEEVGTDAARFFFIMRSMDSQLDFDLTLATEHSNDNPVYYVQYAHARICSILRQMEEEKIALRKDCDLSVLKEPIEVDLIKKLNDYEELIETAAAERAPHKIAHYVYDLAGLFHSFYNQCRVLGVDPAVQQARLALITAVGNTLRHGLKILGVSAPDHM